MAARSEITLGFVGSGKVDKRNASALLRDLIDASGGNARFILPMTKAFWNDNLAVVSDFAIEHSIPVEAVVDDTTAKMREIKHLLSAARRQHQSAAVAFKLATLLEEAKDGQLVVLWDDEDEEALDAVRAADGKGIPLLELTRGLDRIELVADDEDEEEPEPVSDEVPEEEGIVAQDENDEDVIGPEEEEDEPVVAEAEEPEEEDDFPEPEAEDLPEEFPDDEEFAQPAAEDEAPAPVAAVTAGVVTTMTDFQARLVGVLTATAESLLAAVELVTRTPTTVGSLAVESKPAAERALAAPIEEEEAPEPPKKPRRASRARTAPKPEPDPEEEEERPAVVRRQAKPRRAPAAAEEESSNGSMTREQAKKIMDEYRPKRGRPPAEVMEARRVLGLA